MSTSAPSSVAQPPGELPCGLRLVEPVGQHDELVAAEARDGVARANRSRHGPSDFSQHVVADGVTERVVDVLHRIDIDEDQRDPSPVARRACERARR
jgi:hypothetical protein